MDLRTGSAVQFTAAAIVAGGATFYLGEQPIQWTGEFIFALLWLVFVLSIGAISMLYLLIRQGAAWQKCDIQSVQLRTVHRQSGDIT